MGEGLLTEDTKGRERDRERKTEREREREREREHDEKDLLPVRQANKTGDGLRPSEPSLSPSLRERGTG